MRNISMVNGQYRNVPKFLERQAWANNEDLKELSDQGLHCLPFHLHILDIFFYGKTRLFEF